jgi:hypothetical protein
MKSVESNVAIENPKTISSHLKGFKGALSSYGFSKQRKERKKLYMKAL